jgi:outer membrane protein
MIGRHASVTTAVFVSLLIIWTPLFQAQAQQPGSPDSAPAAPPQTQSRIIQVSNQNYTAGKRWFPSVFAPYTPLTVPAPVLTNAPRIEQMIQDGKLRISLQDAIDLALENNLDIAIQRFGPWLAEANILRTFGGGSSRGAYSALGIFPTLNFDPLFSSTLSMDDRKIPVNNPQLTGAGTAAGTFAQLSTHSALADFDYTQGFHTGTSFSVIFNNTRASSTSLSNFFNPSVATTMTLAANQQLLNGFGLLPNERNIRLAKLNKNLSDQTLKQQVITSITAVADAYWELAFARGNVDVAVHQLELANKLYSDNKKQVDVGTLAPLEIVRAEAQVATADQTLTVAQTTSLQDQLALLLLITKDPTAPPLRNLEIITTDNAEVPPEEVEKIPLMDAINEAITKRPDVLESQTNLKADDLNIRATKNALRPILNLSGYYTAQGLAGNNKVSTMTTVAGAQVVDTNGNAVDVVTTTGGTPVPVFVPTSHSTLSGIDTSGLGKALGDMFSGLYPEFNAQLSLSIPIRNRQAQADNATALLTERQDQTRYRQTMNNVAIDVRNAQIALEQARAVLDAAAKTRDLDQQTLDAEQKKFQIGTSTLFNIVSDQNTLASAASAEVRARINLAQAKVNFDRAMGRTLEVYNITIADAKSGRPAKDTLIPGTSATGELYVDPVNRLDAAAVLSKGPSGAGNAQ